MSAYVVFIREKTRDPDLLATYKTHARPTLSGTAAKRLAAYGNFEVMEGAAIEGAMILEFPNMEDAKAWYNGPEYKAAREWRFRAADYRCFIVDGT